MNKPSFKVSKIRYNNQRNNKISPYVTCFPTSVAMTIRTMENQNKGLNRSNIMRDDLDDVIIADIENNLTKYKRLALKLGEWTRKIHPRTIYRFYEYWCKDNQSGVTGYNAKYVSMNQNEMKDWIEKWDRPLIVGSKFTHGGHIVCIVGYDEKKGMFLVNDPYGDPTTGYAITTGREIWVRYNFNKWTLMSSPLTAKFHCLTLYRDNE